MLNWGALARNRINNQIRVSLYPFEPLERTKRNTTRKHTFFDFFMNINVPLLSCSFLEILKPGSFVRLRCLRSLRSKRSGGRLPFGAFGFKACGASRLGPPAPRPFNLGASHLGPLALWPLGRARRPFDLRAPSPPFASANESWFGFKGSERAAASGHARFARSRGPPARFARQLRPSASKILKLGAFLWIRMCDRAVERKCSRNKAKASKASGASEASESFIAREH